SHAVAVDRGSLMVFSDFETEGAMWAGEGPRLVRSAVSFSRAFRAPPEVLVSLEMWDFDTRPNARGDLGAEAVTTDGFDLVFRTWGDSRLARIRVGWIAIGAVSHEDDWQV
ncbi:MAG: H-type lectin domain-containing protein, partial [Pseudomonadota bacterium]